MIKKFEFEDDFGEKKEIALKGNVFTYVIYKNFTGCDLQKDMTNALCSQNNQLLIQKLTQYGIDVKADSGDWISKLTAEQQSEIMPLLENTVDTGFNIALAVSLMATNDYPKITKTFEEYAEELPPALFFDPDFTKELYDILVVFVKNGKKKR